MQPIFSDDELWFRFEDNQVAVAAFRNAAFARVASSESSRFLSHPLGEIGQGESSPAGP